MLPISKRLAAGFLCIAALPRWCHKELAVAMEVDAHGRVAPEGLSHERTRDIHIELDHLGGQDMRHTKLARREASSLVEVHHDKETRLSPVAQMILDMNSEMTMLKPPPGACQTIRVNAKHKAEAKCQKPTKATGCSCETFTTPGCGTQLYTGMDKCTGTTLPDVNVTVVVRCCHIDWAFGWEAVEGEASDAGQSDSAASCSGNKTATGCACHPVVDAEQCLSYGINLTNSQQCLATGSKDNTGGVKAIARCASFVDQPSDFFVAVSENFSELPENTAPKLTEVECSNLAHQMVACHCSSAIFGNEVFNCFGGSIVAQKCQCWGEACNANAICGNIPAPKQDCRWSDWSDWGPCSTSCGNGSVSRARELAAPAYNGGKLCTGDIEQNQSCDDSVPEVCEPPVEEQQSNLTMYLIIGGCVLGVLLLGGGAAFYMQSQKGKGAAKGEAEWGADYGEGEYGADYAEGDGGGY
mmetsp:Transcript_9343/g.17035  ORF Transcript_9343/g.17035 Transcript_9343/m.17035 type:complete len:469 (-) Transcript_9343:73-1479(-)